MDATEFDRACMVRILGFAYHAAAEQETGTGDQLVAALDEGNYALEPDEAGVVVVVDGYRLAAVGWPLVLGEPPAQDGPRAPQKAV